METDSRTVYHIRTGVRRAGRRINDRGCSGSTLCGAPLTSNDAGSIQDARTIVRTDWQRADLKRCDACFGRLLAGAR